MQEDRLVECWLIPYFLYGEGKESSRKNMKREWEVSNRVLKYP